MIKTIYAYKRRVHYYETDKTGTVHHSNHLKWMDEARIFMLNQAGVPFDEIERQGIVVSVIRAEINFKYFLRFNDVFNVFLKITSLKAPGMEIKYNIVNADGSVSLAEGRTLHCFLDTDLNIIRLKRNYPEIYDLLHKFDQYEMKISPDTV